ncbi:AMP-binding protein [Mycobacterium sp. E342]|uniref:AMP-binding protein n=1 Tax=Mycobacterium sp. E342 TaxID=1834147 RepID=UPI0008004802|nr:AMP-binding protein [Mycobacterium sp. E342]OBH37730.1 AMP-binding protein [Mycobacterium sp. E342]
MDWPTIDVDPDLAARYRSEGWWDGKTLPTLVAESLERSAASTFRLHSRTRPWSGKLNDVASLGRLISGGLKRRGIRPGDAVAFQLPNSVEAAAAFYGLAMLGAVLVPIAASAGCRDLSLVVRESRAKALFVTNWRDAPFDFETLGELCGRSPALESVVAVGDSSCPAGVVPFTALTSGPAEVGIAAVDAAAPAVIGWTSGSTDKPKGVILSHRALCAEVSSHIGPFTAFRKRPLASTSPIAHVTGMLLSVLAPAFAGHDIHLLDYWDASDVLKIMEEERVSAGSGVPLFLSSLLDHPSCTDSHRSLIDLSFLGGASVPPELILRASELGIVAVRAYGCTEHITISMCTPRDPLARRIRTDGRLCAGVEVRIVTDAGTGQPHGRPGEVLSRGPELFSGYTNPALNADAFLDGWFRTGDIGVLDDDGYLQILDRKKDIVIRAGMNISAAEIESVMISMPNVAEVAIVAEPHPRTGERAVAVIRTAPGLAMPTVEQLRAHLAQLGVAKYKWPEDIREIRGDFPRTPAGKIRKPDLRADLKRDQPIWVTGRGGLSV